MSVLVQFPGLGLSFTINRVLLSVGGFNIYWYGALIAIGMLLALVFAFHYAPDFGLDSDRMVDVIIVGTVMAIVCARAYYVAFAPFEYTSIWQVLDIRQGGIAIYGSVIGAFVFGGLACKWRRIPLLPMADLTAMGFLIGQAIGRWGNFVNQEAFGTNTTLPWGMYSESTRAYLAGVQAALAAEGVIVDPALPVHPTFLYESLWCALGFLLLFLHMKKRRFHGELFLDYAIWYGVGRFFIEGVRTDALMLTPTLRVSQVVAIAAIAVSLVLWYFGNKKAAGRPLRVPLAVAMAELKKIGKDGPIAVIPDTLPASAPHGEFVKATQKMNEDLISRLAAAHAENTDVAAGDEDHAAPQDVTPADDNASDAPPQENAAAESGIPNASDETDTPKEE